LTRAAELAEPRKDEAHHFLDPQIGIEAQVDLARPNVANRHARPDRTGVDRDRLLKCLYRPNMKMTLPDKS